MNCALASKTKLTPNICDENGNNRDVNTRIFEANDEFKNGSGTKIKVGIKIEKS